MRILPDLRNEPSKTVTLVVESIPSGAKIFLDGEDTGRITTSEFVGLEHGGTKELKLTLPGYEPFTTQVDLDGPAGNKGVVRVYKTSKLSPEGRRLTIDSRPTNASLILDGVFIGNTPHVFHDVENRRGPLEFSWRKRDSRRCARVEPGPPKLTARSPSFSTLSNQHKGQNPRVSRS